MKHFGIKAISMALVFPLLIACKPNNANKLDVVDKVLYGFNTPYTIRLWGDSDIAIKEITDTINKYSGLCDNYNEIINMNNVYKINHSDEPVKIDEGLFKILEDSLKYSEILNGYFNPLMGKLSKLWKDNISHKDGVRLPDETTIEKYLNEVKTSNLVLDKENMTAQIIGEAEIDLGAIAKGYSLDLIKSILDTRNIPNYLINGGDSAIALGTKPGNNVFNVGLRDIKNAYFTASNEMVSTSSMFVQGVEYEGKKYSHIVNPFTGSAETNYDLVIVKGPIEGALLDCMSTAFSCMDLDDIKIFESSYDIDILVYDDGKIVYTSKGMEVKHH